MSAPHAELAGTELTGSDLSEASLARLDLRGTVRVVGGPGTGKSSLLVNTAAAHLNAGRDPESVLLLTGSARLGARARAEITATLLAAGGDPTLVAGFIADLGRW